MSTWPKGTSKKLQPEPALVGELSSYSQLRFVYRRLGSSKTEIPIRRDVVVSSHIQVAALLALFQGIVVASQAPAQDQQDQDVVIRRLPPPAQDRDVVTRRASPQEPDVVIRRASPPTQEVVVRPAQNVVSRVASREEGTAIAQLTLQHWPQVRDKPDCSHLVHDIYAEAGLDYDYAASNEIFEGIESFQRVEKPQPGDLVAWRGHVGIVIDPDDHSFYSSVITGFSVSQFDSSYWISRGPRRFYRYKINDLQSARLLERAARGKPYLASAGPAPYQANSVNNPVDHENNRLAVSVPNRGAVESFADQTRAVDPVTQSPAKPTMEQILAAFTKWSDSNAQALLQTGFLNGRIEILDSFQLNKTETRNNSIWVEFKVKKIALFVDGKMRSSHGTEKVRLSLLRQSGRWTLLDPANRVFLLRRDAVTMIAGRLARLSRASDTAELKPLTKALETLLGEEPSLEPRPRVDLGFQESRAR
jgi:NlpC/P60 family